MPRINPQIGVIHTFRTQTQFTLGEFVDNAMIATLNIKKN